MYITTYNIEQTNNNVIHFKICNNIAHVHRCIVSSFSGSNYVFMGCPQESLP